MDKLTKTYRANRWKFLTAGSVLAAPGEGPEGEHGEDEGEDCDHLEGDERPDPEEHAARIGDPAADEAFAHHVKDRYAGAEKRSEQDDDVARATPREHERSEQPHDHYQHAGDIPGSARFKPADDVVRQMKRHEEDREQRGNC